MQVSAIDKEFITLLLLQVSLKLWLWSNLLFPLQKLDLSEEEARDHFRSKFDEALANAWKTSLNWAFHCMAKKNV